ncbi:MAG: leucine transporter substrate-binding protein [Modestobacter sp.]|nr:leucine transporter substrate-binding protein [Modestobacter sp.]
MTRIPIRSGARSAVLRCSAVLMAATLMTACGGSDDGGSSGGGGGGEASGEPIQVGIIDALTGSASVGGQADVCGARLAVDVLNDEGGVLDGQPLELEVRDSQNNPAISGQAASELTDLGIQFFVGGVTSAPVLAEIPIYADAGALHMGGTTKAPDVIETGDLQVRLNSNTQQDAGAIADYLNSLGGRVVFIGSQGVYGESAVKGIVGLLDDNVEVADTFIVPAETTDYASVMEQAAGVDPDAVVFALLGNSQVVGLFRDFEQSGIDVPLVAASGVLTGSIVASSEGLAEGTISAAIWAPTIDNEANKTLAKALEDRGGKVEGCADLPLDAQLALTYSQVMLLAQGMEAAKSDDPHEVLGALVDGEFDLPQGTVTLDEDGQIEDPTFYYVRAEGDEIVIADDIAEQVGK